MIYAWSPIQALQAVEIHPKKNGKTEQLYKTFPPTPPKKTTISTYKQTPHLPHPNIPKLDLFTNVQTLGGVNSCVTCVKFSPPKSSAELTKKLVPPPQPPHCHFDAAAAPLDSTLKVGSVGFGPVRCSTVGIEEIKEISILVGTDVPLTFWKMMLGVFDHS